MTKVSYQPQYKGDRNFAWYSTGFSITLKEAEKMVRASPQKYIGPDASHRIVEVTERVLPISVKLGVTE
jgi:hypothetical protein